MSKEGMDLDHSPPLFINFYKLQLLTSSNQLLPQLPSCLTSAVSSGHHHKCHLHGNPTGPQRGTLGTSGDWGTWTLPQARRDGQCNGISWRPWGLGPCSGTGVERSKPGRRNANSVPRDQLFVPWWNPKFLLPHQVVLQAAHSCWQNTLRQRLWVQGIQQSCKVQVTCQICYALLSGDADPNLRCWTRILLLQHRPDVTFTVHKCSETNELQRQEEDDQILQNMSSCRMGNIHTQLTRNDRFSIFGTDPAIFLGVPFFAQAHMISWAKTCQDKPKLNPVSRTVPGMYRFLTEPDMARGLILGRRN